MCIDWKLFPYVYVEYTYVHISGFSVSIHWENIPLNFDKFSNVHYYIVWRLGIFLRYIFWFLSNCPLFQFSLSFSLVLHMYHFDYKNWVYKHFFCSFPDNFIFGLVSSYKKSINENWNKEPNLLYKILLAKNNFKF